MQPFYSKRLLLLLIQSTTFIINFLLPHQTFFYVIDYGIHDCLSLDIARGFQKFAFLTLQRLDIYCHEKRVTVLSDNFRFPMVKESSPPMVAEIQGIHFPYVHNLH